MKRLRDAWHRLWNPIYVYDSTQRLVQLQYFQDRLIGITNEGDLYGIRFEPVYGYQISLVMHNPLRMRNYA